MRHERAPGAAGGIEDNGFDVNMGRYIEVAAEETVDPVASS